MTTGNMKAHSKGLLKITKKTYSTAPDCPFSTTSWHFRRQLGYSNGTNQHPVNLDENQVTLHFNNIYTSTNKEKHILHQVSYAGAGYINGVANLGEDSSNLSLNLNAPQINITKTIKLNPRDIKLKEQNLQSEPTNLDHLPRRSYSYTSTDSSNHKRGAQSLGLLLNNKN